MRRISIASLYDDLDAAVKDHGASADAVDRSRSIVEAAGKRGGRRFVEGDRRRIAGSKSGFPVVLV